MLLGSLNRKPLKNGNEMDEMILRFWPISNQLFNEIDLNKLRVEVKGQR